MKTAILKSLDSNDSGWNRWRKALLIGLGKSGDADLQSMREAGAKVTASLSRFSKTITIKFSGIESEHMGAFVEGMIIRDYSYDKYKSKDEDDDSDEGNQHMSHAKRKIDELQIQLNYHKRLLQGLPRKRSW